MKKIEVFGLETIPEVKAGDNPAELLIRAAQDEGVPIVDMDIVVLTSKIISKAMDLTANLDNIRVGTRAMEMSKRTGKDARLLQLFFDLGHEVIAMIPMEGMVSDTVIACSRNKAAAKELCRKEHVMCVTQDAAGRIYTHDAGIDSSNHPEGIVSFPPPEPDEVAEAIRTEIKTRTGKNVAVIIADTEIIHLGTMDLAIGSSGIEPRSKQFAEPDKFGKPKFGGIDLTAYELTSAAALLFGQTSAAIPVAIIRGYEFEFNETENISNVFFPKGTRENIRKSIRRTLEITGRTKSTATRMAMKTIAKFI